MSMVYEDNERREMPFESNLIHESTHSTHPCIFDDSLDASGPHQHQRAPAAPVRPSRRHYSSMMHRILNIRGSWHHHGYCFAPLTLYDTLPGRMFGSLSFFICLRLVCSTAGTHAAFAVPHTRRSKISTSPSRPLHSTSPLYMVSFTKKQTEVPSTSPLSPHTFAGMVEQALQEKFGPGASRIIESWRLLDIEYEHHEFVGTQQDPPITDEQASNCYQQAHSFVPGLKSKTFYDVEDIEWAQKLKSSYKDIKEEFLRVTGDMAKLEKEGNNVWAGALTEDASSYGTGWRTLVLQERGAWDPLNCNIFPKTARAVYESGAPVVEVFFASLKPHTDIKMHSDNTNFVLTSHLALDIPESGKNKCRLTVGDETRQWYNGDVTLFDTSIMHDAVNESDKVRYILMLRVWHPDLTDIEKQALQFTYNCLQLPELASPNPGERFVAELQLESLRKFPALKGEAGVKLKGSRKGRNKAKTKNAKKKGFGS